MTEQSDELLRRLTDKREQLAKRRNDLKPGELSRRLILDTRIKQIDQATRFLHEVFGAPPTSTESTR